MSETVKIELEISVKQRSPAREAGAVKKKKKRGKKRKNFASEIEGKKRGRNGQFAKGGKKASDVSAPAAEDSERDRLGAIAAADPTEMAQPLGRVITGGRFEASLSKQNMKRLGIGPGGGFRGK